jgi:hypothetical protein
MFIDTSKLKCVWTCGCGHKNMCMLKREDIPDSEDCGRTMATRNNYTFFCGRCKKAFNPYSPEGVGIVRPTLPDENLAEDRIWQRR